MAETTPFEENMPEKFFARPRDKSLQAYKDWIRGIVERLNLSADSSTTEEEWEAQWKKFWAKYEGDSDSKKTEEN